jgi:quinol-cytochrome oxidoreductase complex cytochrome b subunit
MENKNQEEGTPFFPNHLLKEVIAAYLVIGIVLTTAIIMPFGLHGKADPLSTPEGIKPEWYFLWMYQLLKYFPQKVGPISGKFAGIITCGIIMAIVMVWPFIDRNPERNPKKRAFVVSLGIIGIIFVGLFTLLGHISESEMKIFGKAYKFDIKGLPHHE